MNSKNSTVDHAKVVKCGIDDTRLDEVSGGGNSTGMEGMYVGGMVVVNRSTYSSGSSPKYAVGQNLQIIYQLKGGDIYTFKCTCEVLDVSKTAKYGIFCKEYGYKVKIIALPPEMIEFMGNDELGKTYSSVYESCLKEI